MVRFRVIVRTQDDTEPRRGSKTGAWRQTRIRASWATSSATPGVAGHGVGQTEDPALVAAHERHRRRLVADGHPGQEAPRRTTRSRPHANSLTVRVYVRDHLGDSPWSTTIPAGVPPVPPRAHRTPDIGDPIRLRMGARSSEPGVAQPRARALAAGRGRRRHGGVRRRRSPARVVGGRPLPPLGDRRLSLHSHHRSPVPPPVRLRPADRPRGRRRPSPLDSHGRPRVRLRHLRRLLRLGGARALRVPGIVARPLRASRPSPSRLPPRRSSPWPPLCVFGAAPGRRRIEAAG